MKTKLSHNMEDYLETIYLISQKNKVVRVKEIGKELDVKYSSVTSAMNVLAKKELINHERYGYIELTPKGELLAKNVLSKHQTLKHFFKTILKVDEKIAEHDACLMEHYISPETFQKLTRFIKFFENWDEGDKCKFINCLEDFLTNEVTKKECALPPSSS